MEAYFASSPPSVGGISILEVDSHWLALFQLTEGQKYPFPLSWVFQEKKEGEEELDFWKRGAKEIQRIYGENQRKLPKKIHFLFHTFPIEWKLENYPQMPHKELLSAISNEKLFLEEKEGNGESSRASQEEETPEVKKNKKRKPIVKAKRLGTLDTSEGPSEQVFFARFWKEDVDRYLGFWKQAGFHPYELTTKIFLYLPISSWLEMDIQSSTGIVDIERERVELYLFHQGILAFFRSFTCGEFPSSAKLVEYLVPQIWQVFMYFTGTFPTGQVERLVLRFGPTSYSPEEVTGEMGRLLGIQVAPWPVEERGKETSLPFHPLAPAYGRLVTEKERPLTLVAEEREETVERRKIYSLFLFLCLVWCGLLWGIDQLGLVGSIHEYQTKITASTQHPLLRARENILKKNQEMAAFLHRFDSPFQKVGRICQLQGDFAMALHRLLSLSESISLTKIEIGEDREDEKRDFSLSSSYPIRLEGKIFFSYQESLEKLEKIEKILKKDFRIKEGNLEMGRNQDNEEGFSFYLLLETGK